MENERGYIAYIAELTGALALIDINDPGQKFRLTLETMAKDAQRWLDNAWAAPNGNTTPIERAIVVLTQDLIVLLGHAANGKIRDQRLIELAQAATDACASEVIVDQAHRDYFTHSDSPLREILATITPES